MQRAGEVEVVEIGGVANVIGFLFRTFSRFRKVVSNKLSSENSNLTKYQAHSRRYPSKQSMPQKANLERK